MKWLYSVCLAFLFSCSGAPSEVPPFVRQAVAAAKGIGDAVLRQKGYAELQRSVPELVPLIDVDPEDKQITLKEVEAFVKASIEAPESVALLVATLLLLRQ